MLTIKFQSSMFLYSPENKKEVSLLLQQPKPLKEVLSSLNISGREIGLVLVNKEKATSMNDVVVKAGDVVELYPFMGGG